MASTSAGAKTASVMASFSLRDLLAPRLYLLGCLLLGGCDNTTSAGNPQDPFEPVNRQVYRFNELLDHTVLEPAAEDYRAVVPASVRTMVSNFFSNLNDVTVTVNDLLQFKAAQAIGDFWRVLTNSTLGVFGLVDMASASGFEKHHEDFGQTLGRWGMGSGPYLILPFVGPTSARDYLGALVDHNLSRLSGHHSAGAHAHGLRALVIRSNLPAQMGSMLAEQPDRYSFVRSYYLQRRQSLVYDGSPPREKYEDEEESSVPPGKKSRL